MMSAALTPGMAAIVLFGTFFALLAVRVPVGFALGLACLPSLIIETRLSPMMLFNETFKAYNSFILLAVPFYLLTASLMNAGGVTERLVRLSRSMVGSFPGALARASAEVTHNAVVVVGKKALFIKRIHSDCAAIGNAHRGAIHVLRAPERTLPSAL